MKNLKLDARPFDKAVHPIIGDCCDMVGELTFTENLPYERWLKVGYLRAVLAGYHNN